MVSLTSHVLMGRLTVTSLGASGAIAGLLAAYCTLHAKYVYGNSLRSLEDCIYSSFSFDCNYGPGID